MLHEIVADDMVESLQNATKMSVKALLKLHVFGVRLLTTVRAHSGLVDIEQQKVVQEPKKCAEEGNQNPDLQSI